MTLSPELVKSIKDAQAAFPKGVNLSEIEAMQVIPSTLPVAAKASERGFGKGHHAGKWNIPSMDVGARRGRRVSNGRRTPNERTPR